jgi:hypothetical protein
MGSVESEALAILALPQVEQRIRLSTVLDRAKRQKVYSSGHELALDFNANLCTRLRELGDVRKCVTPWSR